MEKYQPGEHDKTAGVLQAVHVREGGYFGSQLHHDIDAIMKTLFFLIVFSAKYMLIVLISSYI